MLSPDELLSIGANPYAPKRTNESAIRAIRRRDDGEPGNRIPGFRGTRNQTTQDIDELLDQAAWDLGTAERPTFSAEQLMDDARAMGINPSRVARAKGSNPGVLATRLLNARMAATELSERIMKKWAEVDGNYSTELHASVLNDMSTLQAILSRVQRDTSEYARALATARLTVNSKAFASTQDISEALGSGLLSTQDGFMRFMAQMQEHAQAGNTSAMVRMVNDVRKPKWGDRVLSSWYNGMISNPQTLGV